MAASTGLDTAAVGSKLVRTADGGYLQTPTALTAIDSTDAFLSTPIGTTLTVIASGNFTASVPGKGNVPVIKDTPVYVAPTVTTAITTVAAFLTGLASFNTSFRS